MLDVTLTDTNVLHNGARFGFPDERVTVEHASIGYHVRRSIEGLADRGRPYWRLTREAADRKAAQLIGKEIASGLYTVKPEIEETTDTRSHCG